MIVHNGVKISAEPVQTDGSIIRMQIAATRDNQTISSVTCKFVSTTDVNVYVNMDFASRHEVPQEQTLQLLIPNMNTVHFFVNDQPISTFLEKVGDIWRTVN